MSNAEKVDAPNVIADASGAMLIKPSSAIKLFFPNPSLEQVFFEAIANSLDQGASEILIHVSIKNFIASDTLKISITDNGKGFNDENFSRIKELLDKKDDFHKGTGRVVYFQYFSKIQVDSVYESLNRRQFPYTENFSGKSHIEKLASEQPNSTTLTFADFKGERIHTGDYLKPATLKPKIIEHFLPTLLARQRQKNNFKISINLNTEESNDQGEFVSQEEIITQNDLPQLASITINDLTLDSIEGVEILYQIKSGAGERNLLIAFSIDGRTIPSELLKRLSVPLNHSVIFLFISKLFKANPSRQKLELPDGISESALNHILRREVGKILAEKIPSIGERNTTARKKLEVHFPHLSGLFEENTIGLIDTNDALDIANRKLFKAEKEILQCDDLNDADYEKALELSSRDLTAYILYREKIIRRMKAITQVNLEEEIHNLIVPKYKQYENGDLTGLHDNNAWLLDEKYMSFKTILSEPQMDKVIKAITLKDKISKDAKRPDIVMIFSGDPTATPVDVVVIEIKKKTDDEDDNFKAITQLLGRARKLVAECPNAQQIWFYAVIQINSEMEASLKQQGWVSLFSRGKVFYNPIYKTERADGTTVPTPIFAISHETIVADAEFRNSTFLEILRRCMKDYHRER